MSTCWACNKPDAGWVDAPGCKDWSVSSLSCIAFLDKFKGDLDEVLLSCIEEWTANGCDSGWPNAEAVEGMGDIWDVDIAGDALDDNLVGRMSSSLKDGGTSLEAGLSKLPSLEVFARMAAAAAAAAAATLAEWDVFPDNDVETPFVIVTLDPVGDGIDL